MIYSCTQMATVGVKGLTIVDTTASKGGYVSPPGADNFDE